MKGVQQYNLTVIAGKLICQVIIASLDDEDSWAEQSQQLYGPETNGSLYKERRK